MADATWDELDAALEAALATARAARGPVVVLFSGGVDSGLLAWELRERAGTRLFTVGLAGASDLANARSAAEVVRLPWEGAEVEPAAVEAAEARVAADLAGVPGPRRGIFVALATAMALAPAGTLVCGQGADELFLGYAHYRELAPEAAERRSAEDLATLLERDGPRTWSLAARLGRQLLAPYLDPAFVRAARRVPVGELLPGPLTKPYFRRFARHRGLPESVADAPKRAIQYGSGIDRWLRRRGRATSA